MADKRVERVTADEANLTSPSIWPDIITETVAVGTPNRVTATSVEKGATPVIWSKTNPMQGSKKSLRIEEEKSQVKLFDMSDRDRDDPMIKSAIGRAMLETISRNLFKKLGNFRPNKEKVIPTNAEMIIGFKKMVLSIFINDLNLCLLAPEQILKDRTDNMFCESIINGAKKLAIPRPLFPKA